MSIEGSRGYTLVANQSLPGSLRVQASVLVFAADVVVPRKPKRRIFAALTGAFLIHVVIPRVPKIMLIEGIARISPAWTSFAKSAARKSNSHNNQGCSIWPSLHGWNRTRWPASRLALRHIRHASGKARSVLVVVEVVAHAL